LSRPPTSADIAARFAQLYRGGVDRPTHPQLTEVFKRFGFDDVAPYNPVSGAPNKELRVRRVLEAVHRRPRHAREIIEALLVDLRALDCFTSGVVDSEIVRRVKAAFAEQGFDLTDAGELRTMGPADLSTGGRAALDEQLRRLVRAEDDPALALGSAKDLLEADTAGRCRRALHPR
jgi:hypothetical protein